VPKVHSAADDVRRWHAPASDVFRIAGHTDGAHKAGTYTAKVSLVPSMTTQFTPDWMVSTINVIYRVCIDIPIMSYTAAKIPVSTNRWIPSFFA
jgi:hypothetical protein